VAALSLEGATGYPHAGVLLDGGDMNKIDIVNELSEKINLNQKVAKVVVDTIIDSIKKAIVSGERVEIRGFGSFSLRSYKAYRGRNPKNGEIVDVPVKRLPYFKVGKELKEIIWKEN
jgi:integration host factor subunit beta